MFKRYTREEVIECIRSAFRKVAEFDYGYKFTHNEEDIRASLYRYIREFLDIDQNWRVFLSYPITKGTQTLIKPDIIFTKRNDENDWSLEIIIEMKNWLKRKEVIVKDCTKMENLLKEYVGDSPHLMFLGILRNKKDCKDADDWISWINTKLDKTGSVEIILYPHDNLFCGEWDFENKTDPWLKKFRS